MSRMWGTVCALALASTLLGACAQGTSRAPGRVSRGSGSADAGSMAALGSAAAGSAAASSNAASGEPSILPLQQHPRPLDSREIACWGDSMTSGVGSGEATVPWLGVPYDVSDLSYPTVLGRLTGFPTYNYGVPGATSEDIAFMQGGLSSTPRRLQTVSWQVAQRGSEHPGDILVLEIGSNGGWGGNFRKLIEQYRGMIEHVGCTDYIIIGDTDDPGTSADARQRAFAAGTGPGETAWEAALRKAFGEHFINMRVYLIEHGLELAGLEPTKEDEELADRGCISPQLRADWTHFNSYGYYAQAYGVYERGRELGYWL